MTIEKRWIFPEKNHTPQTFIETLDEPRLVAETLYRRGIRTPEKARAFIDPEAFSPCSPEALPDSQAAWELLRSALTHQKQILVWGDFDVDGQTATALLVEALRELGSQVTYHIPVRGKESHGISDSMLTSYLEQGFDLLLTCDTGITEYANVLRVRQSGIPVIITDHHTLGESLPPANAVVNPQRLEPDHPLRTLPGVGVAYKLMEGLFQSLSAPFRAGHYMELAALGIVADVAELYEDTRYLLQKGLASLRQTERTGLQSLYEAAGLNSEYLNEGHIGFQIGPRLNAVGRLGDANSMVEFLITRDRGRARVLTTQIEALNTKRRFYTRQVEKAAEARLASSTADRRAPAIVLHHPEWPGGVVGIVASRLVERYHKPVILLTGDDPLHGSARSIPGFNITEAIASQAGLLAGFGGHPMAAGLSLAQENFTAFKFGFFAYVQETLKGVKAVPELHIDREITLDQIAAPLLDQVERLAPFGPGNPAIRFLLRDLEKLSDTPVGPSGEHRQVIVTDQQENTQRFIWWNGGDVEPPQTQFDLVCTLSQSDYKGQRQISAEWLDFRLTLQGRDQIVPQPFAILDHRRAQGTQDALASLLEDFPGALVWAEGPLPEGFPGKGRHQLAPCEHLILWTAPPSQAVLDEALRATRPSQVIVFGHTPPIQTGHDLMERLAGLAKYTVHHKRGETLLSHLASACAADVESIRVGLKYWGALGRFISDLNGDYVIIREARVELDSSSVEIYQEILNSLLNETAAYRQYFVNAALETIITHKQS